MPLWVWFALSAIVTTSMAFGVVALVLGSITLGLVTVGWSLLVWSALIAIFVRELRRDE